MQADNEFIHKRTECTHNEKYLSEFTCDIKPVNRSMRLLNYKIAVIKQIPELFVCPAELFQPNEFFSTNRLPVLGIQIRKTNLNDRVFSYP